METKTENKSGVDKGLVAMFLRMSAEERILAKDNALPVLEETLRQLSEVDSE